MATLPRPRTRRSRTLLPDNNSLERGPVPSPSTHRPCDESHTQKLRKGLRSASKEKRSVCGLPPDPGSKCWWSPAGSCPRPWPCPLLLAQTDKWPGNRQGALRPQGCPLRGPRVSITSQRPHAWCVGPLCDCACFALRGCSGNNSAPNAPSTSISSPSPKTAGSASGAPAANGSDGTSDTAPLCDAAKSTATRCS